MALGARHQISEALRAAKQRALDQFLSVPRMGAHRVVHRISAHPQHNVVGVGVGAKIVKGKATARPSVRLYVAHKLDRPLVPPEHRLPPEIEGVETDVVEVGRLRAQILSPRRRLRPARPGCSIGFRPEAPDDGLLMAGTLGAVVARGETRFILSNNHVLANENQLPVGAPIYQPGLLDHGDPRTDAIARLSHFAPLTPSGPNRVDCAIAEILAPELIGTRVLAKVGKLASPQPIAVVEGMSVEKVGRGSGYTLGRAYDVSATLTLSYALGDLTFVDQILIRGASGAFSEDGDSGALVVDVDSGRAAGLLIGGGGEFSIANHLDDVLTELGASLVV
jgi:hypothetical protein